MDLKNINIDMKNINIESIKAKIQSIDKKILISPEKINKAFKVSISTFDQLIKKRFTNQTNKPSFVEIVETIKRDNY